MTKLDKHVLNNGMTILGEPMPDVASAAFNFLLPAGPALLAEGTIGATNVISDWIFRGAGSRSSMEVTTALDYLGLHRNSSISNSHLTVGAAMEASNLSAALDIYADVLLRPHLDPEEFKNSRQLTIDNILGLDDDPRQNVMLKLREQFYPDPLGRPNVGRLEDLKQLTAETASQIVSNNIDLSNTIFSVAGNYDFESLCGQLEKLFGGCEKKSSPEPDIKEAARGYLHIPSEGAQVHIGLMADTVKVDSPDYYNIRAAVSVLSGGMSARLFTEVREKRGLCYAVSARYHANRYVAGVSSYAGTTPDKAQQTYDVIVNEFNRLSEDVSQAEIERAKAGLKSSLIMSSESSMSRAAAVANDFYMLGRVRTLEEVKEEIENTTRESVMDFLGRNKFKDFTVVTIGSKEIKI